jgi:hemolysin activation/secretion protein
MTLRLKPIAACVRRTLPPALLWLVGVPALAVELPRPDTGDVARDVAPAPALGAPAGNTSLQGLPPQPDDSAAANDTTPISVRQIHVTGARLYPQEVLEALVADLNDGTHTLAELMHGAARITQFYRTRGWPLARAYLPAQAVRNGEIEIRVVEGAVSDVRVRVAEGSRLHADVIEAHLAAIQRDAPLEQASVDRALLLLSDLAGANLSAALEAGTQPGQTVLTVDSQPAPLVNGRLEADNYGSRYTGRARLGGTVNLNSPLGLGEQVSARVLASDGDLYYGRLAAQVPVGSRGLTTGGSFMHTRYVLGSTFAPLDAIGRANVAEWNISYPIVRSVAANVFAQLSAEHRDIVDQVGATGTDTAKRARHFSANLLISGRDAIGAGADTQASVRVGTGTVDITSADAAAIDALGAQTAGRYSTLNLDLQRNQRLGGPLGTLLTLRGQLASRNLDSYQKFVLGGANGVRAYPSGEASGDQGWFASTELYYVVHTMFVPSVFYDVGSVQINKHPFMSGSNHRVLHGLGVGVRGNARAFDWSATVAWRGGAPAQAEPDRGVRVWARVGWAF